MTGLVAPQMSGASRFLCTFFATLCLLWGCDKPSNRPPVQDQASLDRVSAVTPERENLDEPSWSIPEIPKALTNSKNAALPELQIVRTDAASAGSDCLGIDRSDAACPHDPESVLLGVLKTAFSQPNSEEGDPPSVDRKLRDLVGCGSLSLGYVSNVRAVARPECAPYLMKQLEGNEDIAPRWRNELAGRALASYLEQRRQQVATLPTSLAVPEAFIELEGRFRSDLLRAGEELLKWRNPVLALPHSPGRTLALATFLESWNGLVPPLSPGFERAHDLKVAYYGLLEKLFPGVESELHLELDEALAHEGAFHTRAAQLDRKRHAQDLGMILRDPWSTREAIRADLWTVAPHLSLERGTPVEKRMREGQGRGVPHQLLKEAYQALNRRPRDPELRRLVGEQHLARALLFVSRDDAQRSMVLLRPIADTDRARLDWAIAQALGQAKKLELKYVRQAVGKVVVQNPATRARLEANRGWPEGFGSLSQLTEEERACFKDTGPFDVRQVGCRPFAWLASTGKD